jgi:hypothetical protein
MKGQLRRGESGRGIYHVLEYTRRMKVWFFSLCSEKGVNGAL